MSLNPATLDDLQRELRSIEDRLDKILFKMAMLTTWSVAIASLFIGGSLVVLFK